MTYDLYIGDYAYSSWSLRGWLLFDRFKIPSRRHLVNFNDGSVAAQLQEIFPARTVPAVRTPEGAILSESLAIAEELAARHPDANLWPSDPLCRATARSLAAEMHAGFGALRSDCPMNLRVSYSSYKPPEAVAADIERLEMIWSHARRVCGGNGPWLCGDYSIADVFFAPVTARIAGYALPVSEAAQSYVQAHLNDPAFRRWRAMGLVHGDTLPWYGRDYETRPWPGPEPLRAKATNEGEPENQLCPYSGEPATDFLETQGRIFGFCNAFCRDKTAADPLAWPAFVKLLES